MCIPYNPWICWIFFIFFLIPTLNACITILIPMLFLYICHIMRLTMRSFVYANISSNIFKWSPALHRWKSIFLFSWGSVHAYSHTSCTNLWMSPDYSWTCLTTMHCWCMEDNKTSSFFKSIKKSGLYALFLWWLSKVHFLIIFWLYSLTFLKTTTKCIGL